MTDPGPQLAALSGSGSTEPSEFRRLFDAHHGFVRRSLVGLGVAPSLVDDACQEVFVVVHRRLDEFDPQRSLRSWLYGIARRVALTLARGEYRAQRKKLALARAPEPVGDLDAQLETRQAIELVERFLATLDPAQREVFVLAQIEGLSAPEVADALDVKLNTVYSRLRLARRRFDRFLARASLAKDSP
jgi:RNA polymerase sigma-70 factor (ECF subfamily)